MKSLPELEEEARLGRQRALYRVGMLPRRARLRRWVWMRSAVRWHDSLMEVRKLQGKNSCGS